MKKKMRSLLGLLLVLAMMLSLAACGEKKEENQEKTDKPAENPEMVYTYESMKLSDERLKNGISPMAYTADGFYGQIYEAVEAEMLRDGGSEETGETQVAEEVSEGETDAEATKELVSDQSGMKLYFVGYDGSVRCLDAYQPLPTPADPGDKLSWYAGSTMNGLMLDKDGDLVAVESVYSGWFDGTEEEMRSDSPAAWEKYRNQQEYFLRLLNQDGSEKSCVKLDYESQDSWLNFYSAVYSDDGTLLVAGDQGIYGFAPDGSLSLQISSTETYLERILKLRDGSIAATGWGDRGMALFPLDLEKKTIGQAVNIPEYAYNPLPGDQNYDFYYVNGMYLHGYRVDTEEDVKILNWLDVDINGNNLGSIHFQDDGSVMCLLSQYRNDKVENELVKVYQVPYESVPHKEILTMAVLYGYEIYDRVVDFNRHNDKTRIQVVDYSEFNDPENDDYDAGRTKLLTEIMSGQVPDLICLSQLPYRQLAAKGLLEDLYPYLDSDKELKREDFFPNVLKALEVNGKLCQVTTGFNVETLIGAASVVGDKPGWTYADLQAALETMPEGCEPLDMYTTRGDLLRTLLCTDLDHFVDWTNGQCSFDSQDFLDLLEFTAKFPAELPDDMEWESSNTRIAEGRQMLTTAYLYSVDSMLWNDVQFGEQGCTYIGYPTNNGVGSYMNINSGYAMSSKCADKEAAWSFLRSFLDEDTQRSSWDGIPLSVKIYREKLEEAMTPQYETDINGEYVLDEKGEKIQVSRGGYWMENGEMVNIYAMTQEQADKLWEAVTTCTKVREEDVAIYDIVFEQAQAFYSGQKSAQDVAKLIQSKVTIYVNEQR